jgi:hypothetical protein
MLMMLAACRTQPLSPVDDALAPVAPTDPRAVACGGQDCGTPGEVCCTLDEGASGACAPASVAACPSSLGYACDGPEDCPSGLCCEDPAASGARCTDANGCIRDALTFELCHRDSDCTLFAGQVCCPTRAGATYRRCQPGCGT